MKKGLVIILSGFLGIALISMALASGTPDEAKTLVEKAITFYKANGKDKTLAEISNPKGQFVKGELYVFIWDLKGTVLAHGTNHKLIGKDVSELKDADGKLFVKEGLELAKSKGSGWVDYKWSNPVNKKIEAKTTFIKKMDDLIFLCGIYK